MNGGKILMRSPKGRVAPVDTSEVEMFKAEGFEVVKKPTGGFPLGSPEAGADVEQQIGGIRRGIGAALPLLAATGVGFATGGPGGGLFGALRGLALESAAAGTAKIPGSMLEKGRLPSVGEVAGEAGLTGATGAFGRVGRMGLQHAPRPLMKRAIGSAVPGMEDELLKSGQAVSNEGLKRVKAEIAQHGASAQAAIDAATRTFDPRIFQRLIRGLQSKAARNDILSRATEGELGDALAILSQKQSARVAAGAPPRMTAREVEGIRKFADDQAKKLHEAIAANKDKVVGADEAAYKKVADLARNMLSTIDDVKGARALESSAIRRHDVVFEALKRAPNQQAALMTGGLTGGALGFGPEPIMAFPGMALGYGLGLAGSSPSGMSAMAHFANRRAAQEGVRQLPRALQLLLTESNALGGQ